MAMRAIRPVFLAVAALAAAASRAAPIPSDDGRRLVNLDPGWRFLAGDDARAQESGFDDSSWQPVDLPHTWNGLDGQDGGGNYRRGAGWYRRHLALDASLAGRRLYLQFDGASLKADVYLNGVLVGSHTGGFARFRLDATAALRPGADNVLAVRVDNSDLGIPPTSSDFTIFGGLYRGVWLLATDPVQVSAMDLGSPGVFIEQRDVGAGSAGIIVRAELENHGPMPRDVDVRVAVLDASRTAVADSTFRTRLDPGAASEVVKPLSIARPHLWDARSDPYLYTVRVELRPVSGNGAPGALSDAVEQPLGIRSFAVDPDRGFLLNGRYLDLHGFNRHQDRPDKGWAISDADEAEDFAILMDSGATAMRTSHYQQSETWYQRCDRAGMVVWTEIPNWQKGRETPEYLESDEAAAARAHPPELQPPVDLLLGRGQRDERAGGRRDRGRGARVAREEDPARLSTYASNHDAADPKNWHTDVVAFNRYYGWYRGGDRRLRPVARQDPRRLSQGALRHERVRRRRQHRPARGEPAAARGAGALPPRGVPEPLPRGLLGRAQGQALRLGKFIWCLFDFASDGRNEGDHAGRNDKGLVTYDRKTKKDAFFFYKANWSREPVVHVTSSKPSCATLRARYGGVDFA
jgi:beta-galactosidase